MIKYILDIYYTILSYLEIHYVYIVINICMHYSSHAGASGNRLLQAGPAVTGPCEGPAIFTNVGQVLASQSEWPSQPSAKVNFKGTCATSQVAKSWLPCVCASRRRSPVWAGFVTTRPRKPRPSTSPKHQAGSNGPGMVGQKG